VKWDLSLFNGNASAYINDIKSVHALNNGMSFAPFYVRCKLDYLPQ
jgi:hypothetical protein